MADPGTDFRRAYQAVLDRTPPAPEWDQVGAPPAPARRRPRRRSLPRWLAAASAAMLLLAVLGGAALVGPDRGRGTTAPPATAPPAADSAPITDATPSTVSDFKAIDLPTIRLDVTSVAASTELPEFEARYLVDGTSRAWNDDSRRGEGAELTFTFADPVDLDEILVHHPADPERFARNYRIARIAVTVDGTLLFRADVPDEPGPHRFEIGRPASVVELRVLETHAAESFGGSPPFEELAVAEVEFFGRAAG